MTKKIVKAAIKAKQNGYTHMASVVKQHYHTIYWHAVPVDEVIETGDWPAADFVCNADGACYREGETWRNLPPKTITRREALKMVDE